jgi:hypothetical protein
MPWLGIPFSETDEYASELVSSARPGAGVRVAASGAPAAVGATQQGNLALVAGAVLTLTAFKVGDPTPRASIAVPSRVAVQRSRRY